MEAVDTVLGPQIPMFYNWEEMDPFQLKNWLLSVRTCSLFTFELSVEKVVTIFY